MMKTSTQEQVDIGQMTKHQIELSTETLFCREWFLKQASPQKIVQSLHFRVLSSSSLSLSSSPSSFFVVVDIIIVIIVIPSLPVARIHKYIRWSSFQIWPLALRSSAGHRCPKGTNSRLQRSTKAGNVGWSFISKHGKFYLQCVWRNILPHTLIQSIAGWGDRSKRRLPYLFYFSYCALMVRICAMSTNMTDILNALAKNLYFFGPSF